MCVWGVKYNGDSKYCCLLENNFRVWTVQKKNQVHHELVCMSSFKSKCSLAIFEWNYFVMLNFFCLYFWQKNQAWTKFSIQERRLWICENNNISDETKKNLQLIEWLMKSGWRWRKCDKVVLASNQMNQTERMKMLENWMSKGR